jgi:hypothetical protein
MLAMLLILAILLVGCEQKILRPTIPFDPDEMEQALKPGPYTITGQAFAKTQSGEVKYAAGNTIILLPLTAYIKQALALQESEDAFTKVQIDKRLLDKRKEATADGEGRFKFSGLAQGEYYMETKILWLVSTRYGNIETGGTVKARINLTGNFESGNNLNHEVILQ